MTAPALVLAPARLPDFAVGNWLRRMRAAEPRFFDLGVVLLIAMVPTALAASVDARLLSGAGVWIKPLKFELSLIAYLMTLALFATLLPERVRAARWYRVYSGAVVLAVVAEMAWLIGAAAMGVVSHFNPTPLGMAIYQSMGALAVLLTSVSAVYAWQIARNPLPTVDPALKRAVVAGLALVLPLTLASAGLMSGMGSSYVGDAAEPVRLAVLGWARDGGDLRVPHFFGTHAMHFIPAFALLTGRLPAPTALAAVNGFAALYAAFFGWTLFQALAGHPFLPVLGG